MNAPALDRAGTTAILEAYRDVLPRVRERSDALVGPSLAERLMALPEDVRERILAELTPADFASLWVEWGFWARPKQLAPPGVSWRWWLYMAGRGSGKSRTGAEWVRHRVEHCGAQSIALCGPTCRDVVHYMIGGRRGRRGNGSGLLDVFPDHQRPRHFRTDGLIEFHTGAVAYVYTAEEPEVRGPNFDTAWLDEPVKWRFRQEILDNIELALRADDVDPQGIITTTPVNALFFKALVADPDVVTVMGASDENRANLAPSFFRRLDRRYSGSRIEAQERRGEIVEDEGNGLFKQTTIDLTNVTRAPKLRTVVVAVDPAISTSRKSDLTGIVVIGLGYDGHLYVLEDLTGVEFEALGEEVPDPLPPLRWTRPKTPRKHAPEEWGELVLRALWHFGGQLVVAETNRGGDLVKANVRAALFRLRGARQRVVVETVHAVKGKEIRAEPVATAYEQRRVHHVGAHAALEAELTEWDPASTVSPNRLDALVWGATYFLEQDDPRDGFEGLPAANAELRGAGLLDVPALFDLGGGGSRAL